MFVQKAGAGDILNMWSVTGIPFAFHVLRDNCAFQEESSISFEYNRFL